MDFYNIYRDRVSSLKGLGQINDLENDFAIFNSYFYFNDLMSYNDFKKCKNLMSNRSKKRKRCFDNYFKLEIVSKLTKAKMVFGTITVNDDFLKLDYENQKKNLQYYLKKHFFYVIKNSDYGLKNDRLHYHFIGLTFDDFVSCGKKSKKGREMYNIKNDKWKWGFIPNYEVIPYNMIDKKRLSNYLVKLNNHSNKLSVKKTRLSILKNVRYLKKYCILSDVII